MDDAAESCGGFGRVIGGRGRAAGCEAETRLRVSFREDQAAAGFLSFLGLTGNHGVETLGSRRAPVDENSRNPWGRFSNLPVIGLTQLSALIEAVT